MKEDKSTVEYRKSKFAESIADGRIFECISCHRVLFRNGVEAIPDNFYEMLEIEKPGFFAQAVGKFETRKVHGKYYCCITC